jgi:hypothetical protein
LDGKFICGETFQVPFTDSDGVDKEFGYLEVLEGGNSTGNKIVLEILFSQLSSELSVEGTAIADESASFSDVTNEALLGGFEFIGTVDPSDFVISERVN